MKKSIFILITFYICINSLGQDVFISEDSIFESQVNKWYFSNIIYVDSSISKQILFQKTRQWFSESFVSAKAVIDNADKEEGVIFGKSQIILNDLDGYVSFNIEIRCKDGRVKYILSNFYHKDAWILSALGSRATGLGSGQISFGPLTQVESPYGYGKSGRNRDKFWPSVKNKTKFEIYSLIQGFTQSLKKTSIDEKDNW